MSRAPRSPRTRAGCFISQGIGPWSVSRLSLLRVLFKEPLPVAWIEHRVTNNYQARAFYRLWDTVRHEIGNYLPKREIPLGPIQPEAAK